MNNKVLFVTATLGGGGAEHIMTQLANKLYNCGFEVCFVTTSQRNNALYPFDSNIRVEQIETEFTHSIRRILDKLRKLHKIFKKYNEYTIVSFITDVSMYSVVASWGLSNRVVLSERTDPNQSPSSKLVRIIRNFLYLWADQIVFQTKDAQKYYRLLPKTKGTLILNPIDISGLPSNEECITTKRRNVIVMICRVKPEKNIAMLIRAIDLIKDKMGDAVVEIYGDGSVYRDQMIELTQKLGLDQKILFCGRTNNVVEILKSAKIYISTSNFEGLSNSMLEAMALGTPSIVTDCPIGGARMVIQDHKNGILVPVNDEIELSKKIMELFVDQDLCNSLGQNALSIREKIDIDKIAKQWMTIL